jgi:hypothetical protein
METSTLFVVRVWRQAQHGRSLFRASVRAVDVEHERVFKRPADLTHYLERASSAPARRDPRPMPNPIFEETR